METRAHHLLIGTFMLLLIAGLFAFAIWLAKVDVDQQYDQYYVYFEGSVAGLNEGGTVRLNGVPVGNILDISIPREDPSRVRILIRIESDVPILEGSTARLELQGFTGLAFVQISGGQGQSEIAPAEGEEIPIIPSERSPIQQVFEEAPNLINSAILAIDNVRRLFSAENRERVTAILGDLQTATGALAENSDKIGPVLTRLEETLANLEAASGTIAELAETTQSVVDTEMRTAFAEIGQTANEFETLSRELQGLVADTRPPLSRFANTALPEASRLVGDLRRLSQRLNRLVEKIADNPQEALFGTNQPVYQPREGQ